MVKTARKMNYGFGPLIVAFFYAAILWFKMKEFAGDSKEIWILYITRRGEVKCVLATDFYERRKVKFLIGFQRPNFKEFFWQVAGQVAY